MKKIKPKKWTEVYPVGTKEGDEEAKVFISLARNPKYDWRSVGAIAKESNLNRKRVEEILRKYHKMGIVFQNPKNDEHWGYWERLPHLLPNKRPSISEEDKEMRIKKNK